MFGHVYQLRTSPPSQLQTTATTTKKTATYKLRHGVSFAKAASSSKLNTNNQIIDALEQLITILQNMVTTNKPRNGY